LSNEPQERWVYGIENTVKLRVTEGEVAQIGDFNSLSDEDNSEAVEQIAAIDAPENNIDERTKATVEDLRDVAVEDASTVMAMGSDVTNFHINADGNVAELSERLEANGYEVTNITPGCERSGTDSTAMSIDAGSLVDTGIDRGEKPIPDGGKNHDPNRTGRNREKIDSPVYSVKLPMGRTLWFPFTENGYRLAYQNATGEQIGEGDGDGEELISVIEFDGPAEVPVV
jgi:hypothetical protein